MSYKPLASRQVQNYAALPVIGTPADTTLDVILQAINNALAAVSGGSGYTAKEIALPIGTTSYVVTIPTQPDTSYVVFGMMENQVDLTPQYQQPLICNKTTTGFTLQFNTALDTANYVFSYIIPFKSYLEGEASIGLDNSYANIPVLQNGPSYGAISAMENYSDVYPQYQTNVITAQSGTSFTSSVNSAANSSNYVASYVVNATGQIAIPNGVNFLTIDLPINYNSSGYGVIAVMADTTDISPQFQPLLVTNKADTSFTVSWNALTNSANQSIYYYVISLTP